MYILCISTHITTTIPTLLHLCCKGRDSKKCNKFCQNMFVAAKVPVALQARRVKQDLDQLGFHLKL